MKKHKLLWSSLLSFVIMILLSVSVFAAGFAVKVTDNYGTLRGTMSQSGVYLNTFTSVTQNQYDGTLHTIIQVTDAWNTVIFNSHYVSSTGALSMSNSTRMVTIIRTVAYPNAAFATHEVRGGDKDGDWTDTGISIDPTPFY